MAALAAVVITVAAVVLRLVVTEVAAVVAPRGLDIVGLHLLQGLTVRTEVQHRQQDILGIRRVLVWVEELEEMVAVVSSSSPP